MDDTEVLKGARNLYIQQFRAKAEEMRPLIQRIRALDQDIGESTDLNQILSEVSALTTENAAKNGAGAATSSGVKPYLRPDEFMGKTVSEAASLYLEKIGHAVSTEELLDAHKRGGRPIKSATAKKSLYISLVRSREFVPIPGQKGFLGLRKFYPNRGLDRKSK